MKRNGRVAGIVLLLALFAATADPIRASGWQGRDESGGGRGFWAVLWQRAVCWIERSCIAADRAEAIESRGGGPRSIFADNGSCVDPNGSPGPRVCAQSQAIEPH